MLYARKELLTWLEQQRIKNNLFVVSAPASTLSLNKTLEVYEMSDAKLACKLRKLLEKSINRSDLSVHPPPPGEGLFRFALLKGKNNEKIQTLIDTGAISVVFKDGV